MRCQRKGRTHNTMTGTPSARGIFTSLHSHHFVTHKNRNQSLLFELVSWEKCSGVGSFTSACPDISARPVAHGHAFKRTVIANQPWIKLSHGCLKKPDDESQLYCRGLAHTAVVIYEGPVPSFMNDTSDEHMKRVESWSLKVHQCGWWS